MNYDEAVNIIEKLSIENKRLKRRIDEMETQRKSTRRGRRPIINEALIQKAWSFRNEGLSMREVAFELGVSGFTVHKILHLNLPATDAVGSFL